MHQPDIDRDRLYNLLYGAKKKPKDFCSKSLSDSFFLMLIRYQDLEGNIHTITSSLPIRQPS